MLHVMHGSFQAIITLVLILFLYVGSLHHHAIVGELHH